MSLIKTKPPLGAKINWSHPLSRGVKGYWLMNEGSGSIVNDISGNGNYGTLTGFSSPETSLSGWNPGQFGKTLHFDRATANFIALKYSTTLASGSEFSLSCWIKLYATDTNWRPLFGLTSNLHGFYNYSNWLYWEGATPSPNFLTTLFSNNKWYHIVLTRDKSNIAKVFVNGVKDINEPTKSNSMNLVNLGKDGSYNLYFGGIYDNAIYYNRALTNKEVMQLYIEPFCMFND